MNRKLLVVALAAPTMLAQADTAIDNLSFQLQMQQQKLEQQRLFLEKYQQGGQMQSSAVSLACLPAPLPSTPRTPNYSLAYSGYGGSAKLVFWREPCKSGTGSALLVRATPTAGSPFFCSASMAIVQNGVQLNDLLLESSSSAVDSFCNNVYTPSTLLVDTVSYVNSAQLNPTQALTIIYTPINGSAMRLAIPASGPVVASISGSASGYKSYGRSCKNIRTGVVKSYASQTTAAWSCTGLTVKSGDTIQTIISGVAK